MKALLVIFKFWIIDDLYQQPYGRMFLNNLAGTPQYLNWLTRVIRPELGDTVLEVGAGIGALAGQLMGKRKRYVVGENEPLYLHALWNRFLRTPNVEVMKLDPAKPHEFEDLRNGFGVRALRQRPRKPGEPDLAFAARTIAWCRKASSFCWCRRALASPAR